MRVYHLVTAALLGIPGLARGQADSVVVRVTSPRGSEVLFSGFITFRDARSERRLENVRTPFELKLPAQQIDVRVTAADGGALSGGVFVLREEKERGYATGTVHRGDVKLYYAPGVGYGFGRRVARRLTP